MIFFVNLVIIEAFFYCGNKEVILYISKILEKLVIMYVINIIFCFKEKEGKVEWVKNGIDKYKKVKSLCEC